MSDAADVLALSDPEAGFAYLAGPIIEYGSRAPLLVGVARCYWRQGNGTQALFYLDGLVREEHIPALFWRAQVHIAYRREYEAIQDLRAYLTIFDAGPLAEEARALLANLGAEEEPEEEE
jgi:hypothetical protein